MNEPQFTGTLVLDFSAARAESSPIGYRLLKKMDGEIVLQAEIPWWQGTMYGTEWRTIPTVVEGEE